MDRHVGPDASVLAPVLHPGERDRGALVDRVERPGPALLDPSEPRLDLAGVGVAQPGPHPVGHEGREHFVTQQASEKPTGHGRRSMSPLRPSWACAPVRVPTVTDSMARPSTKRPASNRLLFAHTALQTNTRSIQPFSVAGGRRHHTGHCWIRRSARSSRSTWMDQNDVGLHRCLGAIGTIGPARRRQSPPVRAKAGRRRVRTPASATASSRPVGRLWYARRRDRRPPPLPRRHGHRLR